MKDIVLIQSEAAAELGVDVKTVREVSRKLGIDPIKIPYSNAKGYNTDAMRRLKTALGMLPERRARHVGN